EAEPHAPVLPAPTRTRRAPTHALSRSEALRGYAAARRRGASKDRPGAAWAQHDRRHDGRLQPRHADAPEGRSGAPRSASRGQKLTAKPKRLVVSLVVKPNRDQNRPSEKGRFRS